MNSGKGTALMLGTMPAAQRLIARLAAAQREAMSNSTLNRSANGRPAWPRGRLGSSSAARPSRPAVVARLAPR
jgi:4'-phosphopantetheinyl transferase EntD